MTILFNSKSQTAPHFTMPSTIIQTHQTTKVLETFVVWYTIKKNPPILQLLTIFLYTPPMIPCSLPNFIQLARSRRAIRRYTDQPVPTTLLNELLEIAAWAPSAHNRQPWRFAVLEAPSSKERLAQAMGQRLRADRMADGDPIADIERDVARSFARITGAPVLIIVCLSMADMDSYPDAKRSQAEHTMAVQSVAMAAQTLWLAAHAAGLGVCWLCAPLFVPNLVQQTLALPPDWQPQGLLTLGWPAERKKKQRDEWKTQVCFVDR
jgi:F420 biosynthesis protein FbiB-like protein